MSDWTAWIVHTLLILGGALMLLAGIGVLRMPDLFTRMQTTTKASALGAGLMLAAAAVHFGDAAVAARAAAAIVFVFLTVPLAAHMIGRAAYFVGVPLWEGTVVDELKGHYDARTHRLDSDVDGVEADEHEESAER